MPLGTYCIKPACFLNVRHLPSFEIDDSVFAGSFRLSIAAAVGVLFVFVITPNIIRYQMAVCNDKMAESKSEQIANVCNTVASVAQLVEQLTLNQLVVGSNPPRGTSLHSPLRCELRLGKLEPSLFDVPVLAEHLKGGSEDFFFREQEQCGNDFWVFALPAHASGGGKNFIASFDGGFSGQRAKPGAQFWLVRNGLD